MLRTRSAEETEALGRLLGTLLGSGDVVALSGELGAGKTVLVRGLVAGAGATGRVASPTFTLIREYPGPVPVYHADLYRLESAAELEDIGLEELFDRPGIVVIEWAERAIDLLPPTHLWIALTFGPGEQERDLHFTPRGARYETLLEALGWHLSRPRPHAGGGRP